MSEVNLSAFIFLASEYSSLFLFFVISINSSFCIKISSKSCITYIEESAVTFGNEGTTLTWRVGGSSIFSFPLSFRAASDIVSCLWLVDLWAICFFDDYALLLGPMRLLALLRLWLVLLSSKHIFLFLWLLKIYLGIVSYEQPLSNLSIKGLDFWIFVVIIQFLIFPFALKSAYI